MRITLVIFSLGVGGAERVCATMANHWSRKGHEVVVVCLAGAQVGRFYKLDENVQQVYLNVAGQSRGWLQGLFNLGRRWRAIRRAVCASRPDVVLSYMAQTNAMTLLSLAGTGLPVLACEHNYPKARWEGWIWETLRKLTYPFAESVVALTQSGLNCFSRRVKRRGKVIPNPIMVPTKYWGCGLEQTPAISGGIILAMGKFSPQKGFDLLILAFSQIAARHPGWHLQIWGDGKERIALEALVNKLGLKDRVKLPGITSEPFEKFKTADIFVLSSRYEGFPLVLCEAMACGLPVVSFACMAGPREIIRDGVDGVLVPPGQVESIVQSLDMLIRNPEMRRQLAINATDIVKRLSFDAIMNQWDDLINRASIARGGNRMP